MNSQKTFLTQWTAALVLGLSLPTFSAAGEHAPKAPALLSQDDLQKRLSDAKLRLLDARPRADYDLAHIPGAVWVDGKIFQEQSRPEAFADQAAWAQALAPLGIASDTEVYIYDGARQHDASRIWWLLSYAGIERVGLVDGGFPLWERQGRPVSSEVPAVAPRPLAVQFHSKWVTTRAEIQAAIANGEIQLLDARSTAEFRGEKRPPASSRAGHIPTARSLDGYDLVDADGKFLDPAIQRERLAQAGIVADRPVIAYSNTGARSSIAVFALKRLGIHVRHYYQGFAEWSKDASASIVQGDKPGDRSPSK